MNTFILVNGFDDVYEELHKLNFNKFQNIFYVYSARDLNVNLIKSVFPMFEYIAYGELMNTVKTKALPKGCLLIASHIKITTIPDANLGILQRSFCDKIILDNHPFLSNANVYYCYFPYSMLDKSVLRYPHAYAFRDAHADELHNPFDVQGLARQVASITKTYVQNIFNVSEINFVKIALSKKEAETYKELKDVLFETENTIYGIVSKLKRFVDKTDTMRKYSGYNLLYPNQIFDLYLRGHRDCYYSDAKVDLHLLNQFQQYMLNANGFCEELWRIQYGD